MAAGPGTLSKLAIAKAATWGTPVTLSTAHRTPLVNVSLDARREQIVDESILGKATRAISRAGNRVIDGAVEMQRDYRQWGGGIQSAIFMGAAGAPTLVETGVYMHTLPFTDDVVGKFATIGKDLGGKKVHVYSTCKPTRRNIVCELGGGTRDRFEYVGRGFDDTLASSAWTYETDPNGDAQQQVLGSHLTMRVNAQSGDALDADDRVYPLRVEVDMTRGLDPAWGQSPDPEEPLPGGFAEISLAATFYGLDTALYALLHAAHMGETNLKADLVWAWPTLLGSTKYPQWELYFPMLRVVECPLPIPGAGRIPFTVRMTAHVAASAPTGFPAGATQACVERMQYGRTTDLLA